jgi:hypothetical protein
MDIARNCSMVPTKPAGAVELKKWSEQEIRNARLVAENMFKAETRVYQHRKNDLLPAMERLDKHFTMHWAGVNSAKTGTAGLSIASCVCLLFPPAIPVGIGLGIGAAVLGGATSVGDEIADNDKEKRLTRLLQADTRHIQNLGEAAKAVVTLTQGMTPDEMSLFWKLALEVGIEKPGPDEQALLRGGYIAYSTLSTGYSIGSKICTLVDIGIFAKNIRAGAALSATTASRGYEFAAATTSAGRLTARATASASTKAVAVVGMAIAVADCANSWYNGKDGQMKLRECMATIQRDLRSYEDKWNRG